MDARMLGVVGTAAARFEIGFVAVERFADCERAAFVDGLAGLPPGKRARRVDRLPVVQDGGRARGFEIISDRDAFNPLSAAVGNADRPCAGPGVASVAEMDARADRGSSTVSCAPRACGGRLGFRACRRAAWA